MIAKLCQLCLFFAFALSTYTAHAEIKEIYVWKNKEGVLVFSDTPRQGAEKIKLSSNIVTMPATDTSVLDAPPKVQVLKFNVSITSPTQEQTIRDNTGSVHVTGLVAPRFLPSYKVQLFLDGKSYGDPKATTSFVMRNVDRGEHNIVLKLIDPIGKVTASSAPITFFMHRNSIITGP